MLHEYTRVDEFSITPIENGFILNKISTGEIFPESKGNIIGQSYFKDHEDMKQLFLKSFGLNLPVAEKGKEIKFKVTIEVKK